MARRREAEKREIIPDPKFNNVLVARFINCVLKQGKKSLAERVVYTALNSIEDKTSDDPIKVFKKAVDNAAPILEVRSRRVGGATYQVPVEVSPARRVALSIRWLISHARGRTGKSLAEKLSNELMDAFNNTGGAVKKKEDVHRMAEANKAFAHYRW